MDFHVFFKRLVNYRKSQICCICCECKCLRWIIMCLYHPKCRWKNDLNMFDYFWQQSPSWWLVWSGVCVWVVCGEKVFNGWSVLHHFVACDVFTSSDNFNICVTHVCTATNKAVAWYGGHMVRGGRWKTDGGHIGQTFKVAFDLGRLAEFIVKSHIKAKN